jgi:hypothetical protein
MFFIGKNLAAVYPSATLIRHAKDQILALSAQAGPKKSEKSAKNHKNS